MHDPVCTVSKARRRLKAQKRAAEFAQRNHGPKRICPHCKQQTTHGHLVPPSMGDPAIWLCDAPETT